MAQIFHPAFNPVSRATVLGGPFLLAGAVWLASVFYRSPYFTQVDVAREQPVPFSHEHHVKGLGLDCRYCHTSVEESPFAGLPPTKTCMNCHSQIWADSPMLEPVRRSFRDGTPLAWARVHDLPDFVHFDHSIHVRQGVGCVTCHGRVDEMPLMRRDVPLFMDWCLDCHRNPAPYLRPRDQVFAPDWQPPGDPLVLGKRLLEEYRVGHPTNCSVCHY
jgi:hypothetical protein